jgi:hypothetical protein
MKKGESAAAAKARELLVGLRAWFFLRFGEEKARKILFIAPIVLAAFLIFIAIALFTPIGSIEVRGDVDMFNEGEIVEASGIGEGDLMILHPFFAVSHSIKENLPLVEKARVYKLPFGKVIIDVEVRELDFYTRIGDKYCAIDENLRVLDISAKRSKYSAGGAAFVMLPETRDPVTGESLIFYDTVEETDTEGELLYEVKEERYYGYVSNFLSAISDNGAIKEHTDGIDLREKFNVTLVYQMKYQVRFGAATALDSKLGVLSSILEDGSVVNMTKAVIDISSPSNATAREEIELDFSEFDD